MRLKTLALAALLLSLPLCAQTTKRTNGQRPEKKQAAASAQDTRPADAAGPQQPSPEIKRLSDALIGRWRVSGKILDQQWAPGGAEGSGTDIVRRGPNGFSVISDSQMDFGKMGPLTGHGVMFWDPKRQGYSGFWCDSWTPICDSTGIGKWEGDKLVFNGEMEVEGQTVPLRQTYSNFTKSSFDWYMESGDGKGGWKPAMSLKYTRANGGPSSPTGLSVQPK